VQANPLWNCSLAMFDQQKPPKCSRLVHCASPLIQPLTVHAEIVVADGRKVITFSRAHPEILFSQVPKRGA